MEAKNVTKLFDVPITVSNSILSNFKNQKQKIVKKYVFVKSDCDCKRRRAYEITIMDLPRSIMVEILSRLPIKPIFRAKSVCKRWYNLITSDPLFVPMYQTRSLNFPCILLSVDCFNAAILELKAGYEYYSRPRNRPVMLIPKFNLPPLKPKIGGLFYEPKLEIIGSCNGFICLMDSDKYDENHSLYISNPLLGEYLKLKLPAYEKRVRSVAYAFCFSEGCGQYKVLRSVVRKFRGRPEVSELEVYTLGVDEKWRNAGKAPYPLCGSFRGSVNVNGALHWLDDENTKKSASIYSFNIRTEEVKPVPAPPGLETPSFCLRIVELGNCLCLSDNNYFQHVDVWWMREYGIAESWTKDRILMDSIPPDIPQTNFLPIIIWKDGEILMQSERATQLISYNPMEKKFRMVNVYDNGTAATRYIPSFYSLKTVMGENFHVSNVYPKTDIV
ncbi:PREDICTED: F-box protein At3g07870-like [Nicotiana attenuata]|uniref:F-box protein n=1 Tax=Nicotiana attenuata TaxID=49451 RepID=A0A1J6K8A5_NICAT|nr:PREDICTED: F-box protein At3g07870-like [Nicotiana attenuata]OIT21240.1 f-box protein [Nicotiana attenuata]